MAIRTVGPNSTYPTIAAAMLAAGVGDTIQLQANYSNETAWVRHNGMTVTGGQSSTGITLLLTTGVTGFTLTGTADINVVDSNDGNHIVGNAGDNIITVRAGADAVTGGLGIDRLIVDYRLAGGAVSGDSTSDFTEAGGGGRKVTITNGTFEHFTVRTGSGADTITTGAGNDIINTGAGASTVTAGQGANIITGGNGADTVTALDGGNIVHAGNGANTITTGAGKDTIDTGSGHDVIVSGAGMDRITLRGGADWASGGAGDDRLVVNYAGTNSAVTGGVTGGSLAGGYTGHIADSLGNSADVVRIEHFSIITGGGNDIITTGSGTDLLVGGAGNDRLNSGGGADVLVGGLGKDTLTGGLGADRFDFDSVAEIGKGATRDIVVGFTHLSDDVDLSTLDGNGSASGNAFLFVAAQGKTFTGAQGQLRWFQNDLAGTASDRTFVIGDVDGDKVADFHLELIGLVMLTRADFIL